MGFGMSFKLAPGVRIRVSSRGVRTSIGTRAARIHVGGGRTRISSGIGPVTMSNTLESGQPRQPPRPRRRADLADLARHSADIQRDEAIRSVLALEHDLLTLHLQDFPVATRPQLPTPEPPDAAAFIAAREQQASEGLSLFDRAKRREAQQWAMDTGRLDAEMQHEQVRQHHAQQQQTLTQWWDNLIAHNETTVHEALEDAFDDNQSPAACIDVGTDLSTAAGIRYATVLIVYGSADQVPEKQPTLTPTGKPTLRKRTLSERNDFYVRALGSTVLATVKEGLAVAPSVTELRVVVLRRDPAAADPSAYLEWIYAARFPRAWVASMFWTTINPGEVLLQAPAAQLRRRGAAGHVAALPLDDEPGLGGIVDEVRASLER
ncbi:DUF4236 domain-containing protein [Mycobacterium frederiksbergense]|uniref:DUF4236 domain-containing protein n=1 Tax=Mycolicibacterium frederiksbergense TaxID=117567 RepID=UPI0021F2ADC2|nr:DUF4236 domain-containing protein [Mycolicibacterium frederiksbergense]MCV7045990.1 DUF4236 domain-containing protein [Mycolicibacterium frederiksbergense]